MIARLADPRPRSDQCGCYLGQPRQIDAAGVNAPSYHAVTALSYNGSGPVHNRARKMIWTIGHSTRALEEFIALLEANGIKLLADGRLLPGSRRYPIQRGRACRLVRREWRPLLALP